MAKKVQKCPNCGEMTFDGTFCKSCGYDDEFKTSYDDEYKETDWSGMDNARKGNGGQSEAKSSTPKGALGELLCFILFILFAVLTVVFYNSSAVELDRAAASVTGIQYVANFQSTIYASACAIVSVLFLIGSFVIETIRGLKD